mmetsp:Transcript_15428/g.24013  ORF Transcript_15428/g.24013 Transcript_15428/m.24013 type:complete len:85 (+) Transcript_15428:213-467(+)
MISSSFSSPLNAHSRPPLGMLHISIVFNTLFLRAYKGQVIRRGGQFEEFFLTVFNCNKNPTIMFFSSSVAFEVYIFAGFFVLNI